MTCFNGTNDYDLWSAGLADDGLWDPGNLPNLLCENPQWCGEETCGNIDGAVWSWGACCEYCLTNPTWPGCQEMLGNGVCDECGLTNICPSIYQTEPVDFYDALDNNCKIAMDISNGYTPGGYND